MKGPEETGGGLAFQPAHFPGRAPVDAYGNGGFRFADMSHKGSILCLPSGIYAWSANAPSEISSTSLKQVFEEQNLEVMLIGTGQDLVPVSEELLETFAKLGMRADAMNTGAAARTFNVLLAEGRAIGAALLAVE